MTKSSSVLRLVILNYADQLQIRLATSPKFQCQTMNTNTSKLHLQTVSSSKTSRVTKSLAEILAVGGNAPNNAKTEVYQVSDQKWIELDDYPYD